MLTICLHDRCAPPPRLQRSKQHDFAVARLLGSKRGGAGGEDGEEGAEKAAGEKKEKKEAAPAAKKE